MESAGAERHRREAQQGERAGASESNALQLWPLRARCPLDLTARMAVLLIAHAPDGLVAVFTDKQAAIFRDGDSDRATPDFALGRDEAGHEIFIFAARFAG